MKHSQIKQQTIPKAVPQSIHQRLSYLCDAIGAEPVMETVTLFQHNMGDEIQILKRLSEQKDFEQVKFLAHKLKSIAANIGAVKMASVFELIENSPAGAPAVKIHPHFDVLNREYSCAVVALNEFLKNISKN